MKYKIERSAIKRPQNWQSRLESYAETQPSTKGEEYDYQQLKLFAASEDFDRYVYDSENLKINMGIKASTYENITYDLGLNIVMDNSRCKCDRCRNECSTVGKYVEHPTLCEYCMRTLFDTEYDATEYIMQKELMMVSATLNENNNKSQQAKYEKALVMMVDGLVKYKAAT